MAAVSQLIRAGSAAICQGIARVCHGFGGVPEPYWRGSARGLPGRIQSLPPEIHSLRDCAAKPHGFCRRPGGPSRPSCRGSAESDRTCHGRFRLRFTENALCRRSTGIRTPDCVLLKPFLGGGPIELHHSFKLSSRSALNCWNDPAPSSDEVGESPATSPLDGMAFASVSHLFLEGQRRGAHMITETPTRQMAAPTQSYRSGFLRSICHPQSTERMTKTPPYAA